ncbi:MAG: GNAT family protein [Patescibacteria group bacterium]
MILKGEKIVLRPMRLNDAPRFVKWLADQQVNKFTTRRPISLKEEKKWIRSLSGKKDEIHFAIDTGDGIHIGSIGLEIQKRDRKADFDILIGDKDYWDKGYGTDAATAILDYGFKKLKLHRIFLRVFKFNKRAIKVYKRLGFKYEGMGREAVLSGGKFYDLVYMGILHREWRRGKLKRSR